MRRAMKVAGLAVIALCAIAAAGGREALWDRVRTALAKGLPRTALESMDAIVRGAQDDRAYAEAVRAITLKIALEAAIQGNHPEEMIPRMQAAVDRAPVEIRPVLEAILAQWTWQYVQHNRWRFDSRTRTGESPGPDFRTWDLPRLLEAVDGHFSRALGDSSLRHTPIAAYAELFVAGDDADRYRPTLFDVLAFEALGFCAAGERAGPAPEDAFVLQADGPAFEPAERFAAWDIVSPDSGSPVVKSLRLYQRLLRFHAGDARRSAFIDADLWRLEYVRAVAVGATRDARYAAALEHVRARDPDHELSARALHALATLRESQGDLVAAHALARRGRDLFPASVGGRRCANLIAALETPRLAVSVTDRVWAPGRAHIEVRYRHLDALHLRLVPIDFEAEILQDGRLDPLGSVGREADPVLSLRPDREWKVALPATPDFRVRTVRTPVPEGMRSGPYRLLTSARADFRATDANQVDACVVWVSDLAVLRREGRPTGAEGFVLDADRGGPVAGAEVRTWRRERHRGRVVPGPGAVTDADGRFRLPDARDVCAWSVWHGERRLGDDGWMPHHRPGSSRAEDRMLLFTDRALYRPGQVIRYKGIAVHLDTERDRYHTLAGRAVELVMRDPDGREVARAHHRTGGHGSFSGSFTAPVTGLRGEVALEVVVGPPGNAAVRVEEYKRPRFLVTLDAPRAPARLAGAVELQGRALGYTGAPVDGARVRWRVTREVRFPDWWSWRYGAARSGGTREIAHGEAGTDAEGRFSVAFVAHPDSAVPAAGEPVFVYAVSADVTDAAGETRSASRDLRVGHAALTAGISAADWQQVGRAVELTVSTTTLDGVPQSARGWVGIARLRDPERLSHVAPPADGDGTDPDDLGPEGSGAERTRRPDITDPRTWDEGETVTHHGFTTDSAGRATITVRRDAGLYRARLSVHDRSGRAVAALLPLRVLDPGARRFPARLADQFVSRSERVEPGGEFLAVWSTAFPGARAFVEVEHRGRVLQAYWTPADRGQVAIRQRVDGALRGGFTVRVTRVCENRLYVHERHVQVPWSDRVLGLRWERFVSRLQPGAPVTWTAIVTRPGGVPAAAEMVATLYDAALDAFVQPRWPGRIGGFRVSHDARGTSHVAGPGSLYRLHGLWTTPYQAAGQGYRAMPAGLLWGDPTYGLLGLALAPAPPRGWAEPPGERSAGPGGRIEGQVVDARGRAKAYVNVIVLGSRHGTLTDGNGRFALSGVPAGTVEVRAMRVGHDPITLTARVAERRTTHLTFVFTTRRIVTEVAEIVVGAERRIDTRSSSTRMEVRSIPVGNLHEAIAVKVGIAAGGAHLGMRGGRGDEAALAFDAVAIGARGLVPDLPDLAAVEARRDLRETAFFLPHLRSGADGRMRIEFRVPEGLTEWRFLGLAHDDALRSGALVATAVTATDLMVQPNPPRFLRDGDTLDFTVRVANRTDAPQRGRVRLTFARGLDGAVADAALGNDAPERAFDLPARASRAFAWRLRVPGGLGVLTYRAVAATARFSDGEEGALPVLERGVLVTESLPLPLRGPGTRTFDFERLRLSAGSTTLRHRALTVQMVSHPAWYAVMALPYLIEQPFECSEQVFHRMYANALARRVVTAHPRIREVFDRWRGTPALDSPLEKDEALKDVTLSETPWLRQARAESRARRDVGLLFDDARLTRETERLVGRLSQMQLEDGAWPWFPGGRADDRMTLVVVTGFGRLRHLGVALPMDAPLRALECLDGWADRRYREILRRGSAAADHLSPVMALYLHGRSFYLADRPVAAEHREAVDFWLEQGRRFWVAHPGRMSRGHLAIALQRFGDVATARDIMRSVREHAVTDPELGMSWRDAEHAWWWHRAPIETQAMMIEAFDEVMADSAAVEGCRVWLLKQKQTRDWRTTTATADAVYALLLRGDDVLTSEALVEVSLGDSLVRPAAVEAGTGFYEARLDGAAVRPALARVTAVKRDRGVAWGSVHWQYVEDLDRVTAHTGTPLRVEKALFVRRDERTGKTLHAVDGPLRVGDELVVRVVLRTDRDMEYVHLKDHRGSGTEPVNVLSGRRWQDGLSYHEETRDVASHFFIDWLPRGTYVFEYPVRVQHRGRYTMGFAQAQCMYAPEFNAHSASPALVVE